MTEEFVEYAKKCAMGDLSAMRWMFHSFEEKLPQGLLDKSDRIFDPDCDADSVKETVESITELFTDRPEVLLTLKAEGFWLNRAAYYGDGEADSYIKAHPIFETFCYLPKESYIGNARMTVGCVKIAMRNMGILTLEETCSFDIESLDENRMFRVISDAGCEDPDEDGFGMEELYNFSYYDEFFNPLLHLHGWSYRDLRNNWEERLLPECLRKQAKYAREREKYWAAIDDHRLQVPGFRRCGHTDLTTPHQCGECDLQLR